MSDLDALTILRERRAYVSRYRDALGRAVGHVSLIDQADAELDELDDAIARLQKART